MSFPLYKVWLKTREYRDGDTPISSEEAFKLALLDVEGEDNQMWLTPGTEAPVDYGDERPLSF